MTQPNPYITSCLLFLIGMFVHSTIVYAQSPSSTYTRETVLDSLKHPWSMAMQSEEEALVAEKDGNLLKVNLSTKEKTVIQGFPEDLIDSIRVEDPRDNSGIFDIVLDPQFIDNALVYIAYAAEGTGGSTTKVIRGKLVNDTLVQIETLLVATPYSADLFHYGGGMIFGPDGKLYITVGERLYDEIDEPELPIAQDLTDKRGKIYRINPDGSIPEDNPNLGTQAIPGLFASGIRAAQGLTVDPNTGNIWFSEHGSRQGDEINLLVAGANYGWPIITTGEYRNSQYEPSVPEGANYTNPSWFWKETVAPTGLLYYTGDDIPEWKNHLIVPGLSKGSVWKLTVEGTKINKAEPLFVSDPIRLRKAVQSPEGKLYLLTDEPYGRIFLVKKG